MSTVAMLILRVIKRQNDQRFWFSYYKSTVCIVNGLPAPNPFLIINIISMYAYFEKCFVLVDLSILQL